jgi:hypothetical protein
MPPKKKIITDDSTESIEPENKVTEIKPKTTTTITSTAADNTRIKLANAIHNLTIKSEELMTAMKNFDCFKESIVKLDIETETKRQEHDEYITSLETQQKNKSKALSQEYEEKEQGLLQKYNSLNKNLEEKYVDLNKKLESDFNEKTKDIQNNLKNLQIQSSQKLAEHKIKACSELAKENGMFLVKDDEYQSLLESKHLLQSELDNLKKNFELKCKEIRDNEKANYVALLKNEMAIYELTTKAQNADIKAQAEQQKREIEVLNSTIQNLKNELVEQRSLTKEVAHASSKAQISQKFSKDP